MDRRRFLQSLGIGAAALTLDPERLLWVPGQKTIFIPETTVKIYDPMMLDLVKINNMIFQKMATENFMGNGVYWQGRVFKEKRI